MKHSTFNIQHRISNARQTRWRWMLGVGCWLLNVPKKVHGKENNLLIRLLAKSDEIRRERRAEYHGISLRFSAAFAPLRLFLAPVSVLASNWIGRESFIPNPWQR